MKSKNIFIFFMSLIMSLMLVTTLFSIPLSSAYFPETHTHFIKTACEKNIDSELWRMCCNEVEACVSGNVLVDISVIWYLERGLKKYSASHSFILCREGIAMARTPVEEAVASGICLHHIQDTMSHNELVPYSIERTGISNPIIHPFIEQKFDDYIHTIDPSSRDLLEKSLVNAENHIDFIQRVLQPNPEYSDVNVKKISEAFIQQVRNSNSGYDVSFNTIKAIPLTIYLPLALIFIISLIGIWFLIAKTRWNFFTISALIFLSFIVLILISALVMTYTGTLWRFFTAISSPLSKVIPTPDFSILLKDTQAHTNNLMKFGIDYFKTLPLEMQDATGINTLKEAELKSSLFRWIYGTIAVVNLAIWSFFIFKSRKKKK